MLFAFYLTRLVGLPPHQMGLVLAIGLALSAAIDAVVGMRLGARLSDARAAARLQLFGSIFCAGAFVAVFAGFWAPPDLRFVYALTTGILFRVAYAFYDIPQNTLMALATADGPSRDRLAATRIWFSGGATLVIALAVAPMIAAQDADGAALFLKLSALIAAPAILAAGLLAWRLRRASARTTDEPTAVAAPFRPTPAFGLLMALMAITSLFTPLYAKVEPFFAAHVLQSPTLGGAIILIMAAGLTLGQPMWAWLAVRKGRTVTLSVAALAQVVALSAALILSGSIGVLVVAAFVFGMGNGGVGMVLWAAFSAVATRDAGGREAAAYGLFTAMAKLCLAIGGMGLGLALGLFDYEAHEAPRLAWLMLGVPLIGAFAVLVVALAWRRLAVPER